MIASSVEALPVLRICSTLTYLEKKKQTKKNVEYSFNKKWRWKDTITLVENVD